MSIPHCRPIEHGTEISNPKLIRLFAYWSAKVRNRTAPTRCDINPAEIPRLLPWVWLIDVVEGGADFRFRLGGEKLVEFLGRRMAGETINAHRATPLFANVGQALTLCVRDKRPIVRQPAPTSNERRNLVETEALFLPLSDNGLDISQVFGGFAMTSPLTTISA